MLSFDSDACIRSLVQRLIQVMDSLMSEFYGDATYGMTANEKNDTELVKAIYDQAKEIVEAKCMFYTNAIIASFGTGSQADTSSKYWKDYLQMTDENGNPVFNPARHGNRIVGREEGPYTDIWGRERSSGGRNAGKNMEGVDLYDYNTGKKRMVVPVYPTKTIQNAEAWIMKNDTETKIERRVKMEVEKFFAEEGSKFFIETGG